MSEIETSHGVVAGATGLVSGVISWLTLRGKRDESTCLATHKAVDESLARIERVQGEMFKMLNQINSTLVAHVSREAAFGDKK